MGTLSAWDGGSPVRCRFLIPAQHETKIIRLSGPHNMKILVLNPGSSSQKSALFELGPDSGDDPVLPLWEGKLEWSGDKEDLHIRNRSGQEIRRQSKAGLHRAAVGVML